MDVNDAYNYMPTWINMIQAFSYRASIPLKTYKKPYLRSTANTLKIKDIDKKEWIETRQLPYIILLLSALIHIIKYV